LEIRQKKKVYELSLDSSSSDDKLNTLDRRDANNLKKLVGLGQKDDLIINTKKQNLFVNKRDKSPYKSPFKSNRKE